MNLLRNFALDSDSRLAKHFMPHQLAWIQAEKAIHDKRKQAVALAEKSVRIGWTYADAFKNVRKRILFSNRDYLYFALRKTHNGTKWAFSEGKNALNQASHCDIAWAGALATHAHTERKCTVGCAVFMEDGTIWSSDDPPGTHGRPISDAERERRLMLSDDPRIWQPLRW